jgi:hypothetical protein
MYSRAATLIGFLLACSVTVVAQFTPAVARVTQDVQITKAGKVIETHKRTGTYYRSANGSQLYHWDNDDGKPDYAGSLNDNSTGVAYQLDFRTGKAIEGHRSKPLPAGLLQWDKVGDRPRDSVEGLSCVVYSPGTQKQCWSIDYFLMLWQDVSFPLKNDPEKTYRIVSRMSNIKLNAEIDPKVLDVHQSFTVLKPEESKQQ